MPSSREITLATGNTALANKIGKYKGYKYWADRMGLEMKKSESRTGIDNEFNCKEVLEKLNYKVKKMDTNHPYDLLINDFIKVDVKASKSYNNNNTYSFRIGKKYHSCDIFIAIALNENEEPIKYYVIPSKFLMGKKQLAISVNGKYKIYENAWKYIDLYDELYKSII